jgi:DNA polymerase-3 subunit gamma/tau
LLELVHTLTRLKSIPGLRESHDLPEAERTRGGVLADGLSVPVLARAWQMLLKGVGEVESSPDRRAAAEMVLIRLCHVADTPPPGELVRRLTSGASAAATASPASPPSGGGVRAVSGGTPVALAVPEPATVGPRLASFRDVAALLAEQREAMLHAHLVHSVHLVRFAPPVLELRPEAAAPKDLSSRLAALLTEATGNRWTVVISTAAGEPTLAEQGNAADAARRAAVAEHPQVRAILEAFPGARIEAVHDSRVDAYGLAADGLAADGTAGQEADMPAFAPPDAEPADDEELDE